MKKVILTVCLFLGWIMALPGVKIIGPDKAVEQMKEEIKRLSDVYGL